MLERFTPEAKKIIEGSLKEALRLGCPDVREEHLLLALCRERGIVSLAFSRHPRDLRQDIMNYLLSEQKQEKAQEKLDLSPAQVQELVSLIQQHLLKIAERNK